MDTTPISLSLYGSTHFPRPFGRRIDSKAIPTPQQPFSCTAQREHRKRQFNASHFEAQSAFQTSPRTPSPSSYVCSAVSDGAAHRGSADAAQLRQTPSTQRTSTVRHQRRCTKKSDARMCVTDRVSRQTQRSFYFISESPRSIASFSDRHRFSPTIDETENVPTETHSQNTNLGNRQSRPSAPSTKGRTPILLCRRLSL